VPDGVGICAVIVDYYSAQDTVALAASLVEDTQLTEVLVVDNTGDPGYTIEPLPERAKIVKAPIRQGYGAGVNLGVGCTQSAYVLALNSDLLVHRGQLSALADYLDRNPEIGLAAPLIQDRHGAVQTDAAGYFPRRWGGVQERREWRTGAAFMMRRETFEHLGGFDERYFMYWEDTDLCLRLHYAGLGVATDDAVIVVHTSGGSDARTSSRYRNAATSRDLFLRRWNYPVLQRILMHGLSRFKLQSLWVRGL